MVRKRNNNDERYAPPEHLRALIDDLFTRAFQNDPSLPGREKTPKMRKSELQKLVRIPITEISPWSKGNKSDAERISNKLLNFFSGDNHYIDIRKNTKFEATDREARVYSKRIGELLREREKNDVGTVVEALKLHLRTIKSLKEQDLLGENAERNLKLKGSLKNDANGTAARGFPSAKKPPRVRAVKNVVKRKNIFDRVISQITDAETVSTADGSFALVGGGGYGKSTLAAMVAHEASEKGLFERVVQTSDIGKDLDAIIPAIHLIALELEPTGEHPKPASAEAASELLARVTQDKQVLLVVDNVWLEAQVDFFSNCGPDCVVLFTTRVRSVVPEDACVIDVGRMTKREAFDLLRTNLDLPRRIYRSLRELAETLLFWPQLLAMANRVLVQRCRHGQDLETAIFDYIDKLERKGIRGLDLDNQKERSKAVEICFDESVEELSENQLKKFMELGAFMRSAAIPIDVIAKLWGDPDAEDLLLHLLDGLALVESVDYRSGVGIVALHDNVTEYLRQRAGVERLRQTHIRILDGFRTLAGGNFQDLPGGERYGWSAMIYHLTEAGQISQADELRSSYAWLKGLLSACDIADVVRSFTYVTDSELVRILKQALIHSGRSLARTPKDLPRQMVGRLSPCEDSGVQEFLNSAVSDDNFMPRPIRPHLRNISHDYKIPLGHVGTVRCAVYSPDGRSIATASWDGSLMIWDACSYKCTSVLSGHTGQVQSVSWGPEGDIAVSGAGAGDHSIRVWDVEGEQHLRLLGKHNERVRWVTFDTKGSFVVSVSHDRCIGVWDIHEDEVQLLEGLHPCAILTADIHRNRRLVATASQDEYLRIIDLETGSLDCQIKAHTRWLKGAFWHPLEDWIVTASDDGSVSLWQYENSRLSYLGTKDGFANGARSAAFSPDGKKLVVASGRKAEVFSVDVELNSHLLATLNGHTGQVLGAQFSPCGSKVVTASHDHTARVFNASDGQQLGKLGENDRRVRSVSLSTDGKRYVAVFDDGALSVVSLNDQQELFSDSSFTYQVAAFANLDDAIFVVRSPDTLTKLSASGQLLGEYPIGHQAWIHDLVIPSSDRYAITASEDNTARITMLSNPSMQIKVNDRHSAAVKSVSTNDSLTRIFCTSDDRTATEWNRFSTGGTKEVIKSTGAILCSHVSPSGDTVAFGSSDMLIYLSTTDRQLRTIKEHTGAITSVKLTADGEFLISGSQDKTVKVFRCSDLTCLTTIELDASVSAISVRNGIACIGDNLGNVHHFELPEKFVVGSTEKTNSGAKD